MLFAELMDKENSGWAAAAVLLIGTVAPWLYKFWEKSGSDNAVTKKTTIDEYKELLATTNKTLQDTQTMWREREDEYEDSIKRTTREHIECLRKYDQLTVRMEWMESELRKAGVAISIWPRPAAERPAQPTAGLLDSPKPHDGAGADV